MSLSPFSVVAPSLSNKPDPARERASVAYWVDPPPQNSICLLNIYLVIYITIETPPPRIRYASTLRSSSANSSCSVTEHDPLLGVGRVQSLNRTNIGRASVPFALRS